MSYELTAMQDIADSIAHREGEHGFVFKKNLDDFFHGEPAERFVKIVILVNKQYIRPGNLTNHTFESFQ